MQVSLTDYTVFEANGCWNHIEKKINAKTFTIEYDVKSGFESEKEALESYQISEKKYKSAIKRVKSITQNSYTFVEYLKYWHQKYLAEYSTSSSQVKYFWVIYKIIMPKIKKDVLLSMLTDSFINDLISDCKTYSLSAGEITYKVLSVILKEAERNSYISPSVLLGVNPCYSTKKKMQLYNKEQMKTFLRAAKDYHSCYLEIMLALFCGLRTGEILALKYSDFHKISKNVMIERQYTRNYTYEKKEDTGKTKHVRSEERTFKPPKTVNSIRCLTVPPVIFEELNVRKKENKQIVEKSGNNEYENYVCLGMYGTIKSEETFNAALSSITKANNLPHISMHSLRHMFATACIELNIPLEKISKALGHKNVNTTFDIYCGIMDATEQIRNTVSNTMDPALNLKNEISGGTN